MDVAQVFELAMIRELDLKYTFVRRMINISGDLWWACFRPNSHFALNTCL